MKWVSRLCLAIDLDGSINEQTLKMDKVRENQIVVMITAM